MWHYHLVQPPIVVDGGTWWSLGRVSQLPLLLFLLLLLLVVVVLLLLYQYRHLRYYYYHHYNYYAKNLVHDIT